MKTVTAYRTSDGATHCDHTTAERHALRRYDEAMTKLRIRLQALGLGARDAGAVLEMFEKNPAPWLEAVDLKADVYLEPTETPDEE